MEGRLSWRPRLFQHQDRPRTVESRSVEDGLGVRAVILKSETYHFHRLNLTRQAGFIVTIYDEDGLRLAATMPLATPADAFAESAEDRGQQGRGAKEDKERPPGGLTA